MFFAVDDDGGDLLIEEDENGAEQCRDYGERNQPVVRHIQWIDHPIPAQSQTAAQTRVHIDWNQLLRLNNGPLLCVEFADEILIFAF